MRRGGGGGGGGGKGRSGLLPSSLRIISSCLKSVSSNAGSVAGGVRSAGAAVASSIAAAPAEAERDQVLWAGFDKLDLGPSSFKHVLLLGYINGFQVLDVEDASNVCEMVSKRDGPVTYLQVQPTPLKSEVSEGFKASHPLLLVVAGDETNGSGLVQGGRLSALISESTSEPQHDNCISTPTVVRFFSLKSHTYVHVLRFRSAVYIVRCSPRIVAVALAAQIYCFDPVTFENKFSVLTYPLQGAVGVSIGYGPMAVGSRWLAYASNSPLLSNVGRLSPQNLTPSPGVSPSTSPGNGSLVARYAMESSKQLAAGILNLGDMGYKTLSKYYQELLPDGSSSPLSSYSSRRFGRASSPSHPSEADNAGMVVVKDFVSKEVISQFRAHTSPISALCFDPSGTLLVTASVHGHNINVFRIMPTLVSNGSGSVRYDWASSHAHLYKLYRGLTTAVIQDISFSHYSQWVAIVSSRGTCHIFVLSPFGGDASLQKQTTHTDGPSLTPSLTLPWWSTSSSTMNQRFISPPSPITLSVISRIKNSNSGWLNTVSNAAANAAGKIPIPSGAMASVFHNSLYYSTQQVHSKSNPLEHLLIYSPSGQLIQHELIPSASAESSDSSSRTSSGSFLQFQDDELHIIAEPVQWWDVCRRSNWPEREETISRFFIKNQREVVTLKDASDCEDSDSFSISSSNCIPGRERGKTNERPHWYLSNAEVQVNSGIIPIWQNSKICFCVMASSGASRKYTIDSTGGEVEIEKTLCHEVEMRRKDILPALEQYPRSQSFWGDRAHTRGQDSMSEAGDKLGSDSSTATHPESGSDGVSLHSMEKPAHSNLIHSSTPVVHCERENGIISAKHSVENSNSFHPNHSNINFLMDEPMINGLSLHSSAEVGQYFLEGYCGISENNGCQELMEGVIKNAEEDGDSDNLLGGCQELTEGVIEKAEGGDGDDLLGGVFAFSEEIY